MPATDSGRPVRVALTGGIATGKSHVRARFNELGVPTVDADALARAVVAPGTPGLAAVVERFGTGVLDRSGSLNRRTLAAIVFADPAERRALEAIIHPQVQRATEEFFERLDGARHPFAIADIPLLYETGRDRDFTKVIVTACDLETQIRRVTARNNISEDDARRRIAAQLPIEEKVKRADYVIRTDGSFADTDAQVKDVFSALQRDSRSV
jgi:dephospho-CoA kinase